MNRALVIALVVAAAPARAQAPETTYIVEAGDTCLGIAVRILGDRGALDAFHKLNPQLGPLPHDLAPGAVVNLPARPAGGPDARLSRATGDVKIRKPSTASWDPAQRGMDLFRAWRIGAAEAAAAELTFRDDSRLGMRERTIVVIYGPEKKSAKVITATADLLEGALEARLGDLDGKPVVVRTPAAQADLRAGDTVVSVAPNGPSIIANHRGTQVAVRGRSPTSKAVIVAAGMGSRVLPGKDPEPPRPLPPTPAWATPATAWAALYAPTATATIAWTAIATAKTYRVAVTDAGGDTVTAAVVAAPARSLDLTLAPGTYRGTVSATDADGFEGAPSAPIELEIAAGSVIPVGSAQPVTGQLRALAVGSAWIAPAGWTCRAGADAATDRIVLGAVGSTTITCTTPAGRTSAPIVLETVGITLVSPGAGRGDLTVAAGQRAVFTLSLETDAPLGTDLAIEWSPNVPASVAHPTPSSFVLTIDATHSGPTRGTVTIASGSRVIATRAVAITAVAAPPAPRARSPWSVGAFAGYQWLGLGRAVALGEPVDDGAALDRGSLLGARAGYRRHRFGVEAELGFARPDHVATDGTATALVYRVHGLVKYERGWASAALLAGAGAASVVRANGGIERDTDLLLDWGGSLAATKGMTSVRIDLRHVLLPGASGLAQSIEVTAGLSFELPH